jgi:hypothetical protein
LKETCGGCGAVKSSCDDWKRQGRVCCPDCTHGKCPHEWEQVWIAFVNGEAKLVGPFRCRLCRALQEVDESPASDAVDPIVATERQEGATRDE